MIIIDENIDQFLVRKLEDYTADIISIREDYSGVTDRDIIKLAKTNKGLVITEDKDFGELIFAHNIRGCSVILLRYGRSGFEAVEKNLFKALKHFENNTDHYFITVTDKKIRVRKI